MPNIIRGETARLRRENDRLKRELGEKNIRIEEIEAALVELGELYAEQDDAIVELAGLIDEQQGGE